MKFTQRAQNPCKSKSRVNSEKKKKISKNTKNIRKILKIKENNVKN